MDREKMRAYQREYYLRHREEILAKRKRKWEEDGEWRKSQIKRQDEYMKRRRATDRVFDERMRVYDRNRTRRYRECETPEHREHRLAVQRQYDKANREKAYERAKAWRQRKREGKRAVEAAQRRAALMAERPVRKAAPDEIDRMMAAYARATPVRQPLAERKQACINCQHFHTARSWCQARGTYTRPDRHCYNYAWRC